MKKILPIMFISSTALIAVAGFVVSSNGNLELLKAEDNLVTHTRIFNHNNVSNFVRQSDNTKATFTLTTKTDSDFDFGCEAYIESGFVAEPSTSIARGEDLDNEKDGIIRMTFTFVNVISAVSVELNGDFEDRDGRKDFKYTYTPTGSDKNKISINQTELGDFEIQSIVVKYTCGY